MRHRDRDNPLRVKHSRDGDEPLAVSQFHDQVEVLGAGRGEVDEQVHVLAAAEQQREASIRPV
jgi:hypothetical protein